MPALEIINTKTQQLNTEGHKNAALAAARLYSTLDDAIEAYDLKQKNEKEVRQICAIAIANARPVLEKHRGWTEVLNKFLSILVSVFTIGIANFCTGKAWLFSSQTDSAQKLNALEELLKTSFPIIPDTPLNLTPINTEESLKTSFPITPYAH